MRYFAVAAVLVACTGLGLLLESRSAAADDAKDWGTIKGQVVFAGDKLPDPVEAKVDKDQAHCLEKGKIFSEEWVINKQNKGLRWVFVWLTPDPKGDVKELPIHPSLKEIKDKEVEIDQPCCMFVPHAIAMRQGQVLVAKNSSPIPHNTNYTGNPLKNPGGNPLLPPKSSVKIADLKADEKFPITVACTIHGWMKAYVRVYDHPYYAVTDENGNFEIKLAPKGDWRLKVWGDPGWLGGAAGRDGKAITVKGGEVLDLGQLQWKP